MKLPGLPDPAPLVFGPPFKKRLLGGLACAAVPCALLYFYLPRASSLPGLGAPRPAVAQAAVAVGETGSGEGDVSSQETGVLTPETMRQLSEDLSRLAEEAPARAVGVYVQDIPTGLTAGVNANRYFLSASLIKLQVMAAAYRLWERKPELKTARTLDWMERMITESDNPSTDALIDMVGGPEVCTRLCAERGWKTLRLRHAILNHRGRRGLNQCTAREMAELLVALDRRTLVGDEADEEMWAVLRRQKKRRRIPGGVPSLPGVVVGNKTGTLGNVLHDAGIVHTPGTRYALCILLSGQRSEASGDRFCRKISNLVFKTLNGPERPAQDIASSR